MINIARKNKQVKRKELTFDMNDWEKIERRAEACQTDTTKYYVGSTVVAVSNS